MDMFKGILTSWIKLKQPKILKNWIGWISMRDLLGRKQPLIKKNSMEDTFDEA